MSTVWLAQVGRSGDRTRYHTDKDCPFLNRASGDIREKDLSVLNGHKDPCKWCEGYTPPKHNDPMGRVNKLIAMNPEDV